MDAFQFKKKKILIISPEPWDYIKVSKHHYALWLAKHDNEVYFLNPPEPQVKGIEVKQVSDKIHVIDYKDPYKGLRFFPKPLRKLLQRKLYVRIERAVSVSFDVVFLFENSRFYDLDFLPKKVVSIYFQVDEDQNFHPAKAAKTASLVIAINDIIRDILLKFRFPVYQLSHGFSGQFTQAAMAYWKGEKVYHRPDGRLRAFYIGNLDNHFINHQLIAELVQQTPEVDFEFIGPYEESGALYSSIHENRNAFFRGRVAATEIPSLLDEADLLFYLYKENFLSASHKVMEYLASGKVVVTTEVKGYMQYEHLFYCSQRPDRFIQLFKQVCADIESANSPEKMKERIQFALDNTYEKRVKQVEALIAQSIS